MTARHFAHMTARMKPLILLVSHTAHACTRARMCKRLINTRVCMCARMCAMMRAPRAVRAVCGLQACGDVCGHVYARAVYFFISLKIKK